METTSTVAFGLCICYSSPGVVERIGGDWDWIWLDGQHGELDERDLLSLVRACDLIGRPAYVRVPSHEAGRIGRTLDMGAAGVIVPLVDSVEQARALVQAARFPPLGNRSYGGRRVIDRHGRHYVEAANHSTRLLLQIESPLAAEQAELLASIEGVDGLFLGLDDYMLRNGCGVDDPKTADNVGRAFELTGAACRRHGKLLCAVGVGASALELCLEHRCDLVVAGSDVGFLASGSRQAKEAALLQETTRGEKGNVSSSLYG